MDNQRPSNSKFDRNNSKVNAKKGATDVDREYMRKHPDYKPGVWMRNASSLSEMDNGQDYKTRSKEMQDRIIEEEIERYINDYNREKKGSTRDLKDKINNEIRQREMLLETLKRKDLEGKYINRKPALEPDPTEEKRKIEMMYQRMMEDDLEKQRQLQREQQKMNELIERRIEEQDRLLLLERMKIKERNKRLLDEEQLKNEIERNKLRELKKQREELLKEEISELTQIEKHEKKKKLIEEELKRSIKEREAEKQRFADINKKIEELRQRELEELARIKNQENDVSRRRKELLEDAYVNKVRDDDVIEVWPCGKNSSKMVIVEPNDLCVDPFSGKLVIRGDLFTMGNKDPRVENTSGVSRSRINVNDKPRDHVFTRQKYVDLLSTYDPKKLARKLSYQNWLINESNLDEGQMAQKFVGSNFSLQVDMTEWPAIKQESMKRYASLKSK